MTGPRPQDWLLLGLLVVLWGSAFGLTEVALRSFSPLQLVTGRLWIGAAILLVVVMLRRRSFPRGLRAWMFLSAMAVLGNALPFFLISWGQQVISSGLTGILMAIMPIVVLFMAHFFLPGEKLTWRRIVGFLLGFGGILILTGPEALARLRGEGAALLGQLTVLAGAVCYGVNLIIARRSPRLPADVTAGWVLLGSALLASSATLLSGEPWPVAPRADALLAVFALGVLSTGLATVVYFRVVARAGATFLSLINYLIPVYAVLFGAVFLGEHVAGQSLVALVIILLGVLSSQGRLPVTEKRR